MHHTTAARNEIGPLLDQLIRQLDAEGSATQKAHFKRIRVHLYGAHDNLDLTQSMIELATCTAMGFRFSNTADALVNRILTKTIDMVTALEGIRPVVH